MELILKSKLEKTYGLIGESGSGKSTLLKLLTGRIENYEGAIKFNGEELEGISKHSLYDKMLYIPQEPYIFYRKSKI